MLGLKLNHVSKRGHRSQLSTTKGEPCAYVWEVLYVCNIHHSKEGLFYNFGDRHRAMLGLVDDLDKRENPWIL